MGEGAHVGSNLLEGTGFCEGVGLGDEGVCEGDDTRQ